MKIPTYDTPQVEARALPGVRESSVASPALFGAAAEQQASIGKGVLGAGNAIMAAAGIMQDRENADMLFRAETALKDDYLNFEASVRERKGQNAWGATKDTEEWFADQEKKHSETLQNDVQRKLFSQSLTKLRQAATGTVSRYEADERRRSIEESARASIVGAINLAAANAAEWYAKPPQPVEQPPAQATTTEGPDGTPVTTVNAPVEVTATRDPLTGFKSDIIKRVQVLTDLNGWSPERKQFEEAQHLTNLHKQIIQNLVDKDPSKAREYFDANKEEINGGDYEQIGRVLKTGEVKQAGFEFANRPDVMALATDQDRLAAARDYFKDDPEKREAAIQEIKTRSAEATVLRERGQRDAADQAWGIFARTGRMSDIPSTTLNSMDGHALASLKDYAANKAAGKATVTDPGTYYDLRQMAAGSPDTFRKLDLRNYINRLSPSDFEEMVKLQTADAGKISEVATLTQQLSNTHDLLGWRSSDREKKGMFDKAVTEAIDAEQVRSGGKLDYKGRQAVIDRLLIEGDINGRWPGGGRRYFEVQGTPDAAKFVPTISDTDRKQIVDRFTKRTGRAPTDTEVIQTFKTWKGL